MRAAATYTVVYPHLYYQTGKALRFSGRLQVYRSADGVVVTLEHGGLPPAGEKPKVSILDPRAVILNEDAGTVDYSPRFYYAQQERWVQKWLDCHSRWGIPGCERDWESAVREDTSC